MPFNFFEWLDGKKVYIVAFGVFIVGGMQALHWISDEQAQVLLTLLGAGAITFVRSAITKVQEKQELLSRQLNGIQGALNEAQGSKRH